MNSMDNVFDKIQIPPLTMGTVALGIPYAVFENQQKPDIASSLNMLNEAYKLGITCFDTAREYGDAEGILGEFGGKVFPKPLIVSKFKLSASALNDKDLAFKEARVSLDKSLEALKLEELPVLLFHNTSDLDQEKVASLVPAILAEFRASGLIRHGGLSIDHPSELKSFIAIPEFKVFQIPLNVLDQRLPQSDEWADLLLAGKTVIARSVFLKGLLLQSPDSLTGNLIDARIYLEELNSLAGRAEMSLAQFCFSYVRDLPGVSSIVFGAEHLEQLKENVRLMEGPSIPPTLREEAEHKFKSISETILTPRLWSLI